MQCLKFEWIALVCQIWVPAPSLHEAILTYQHQQPTTRAPVARHNATVHTFVVSTAGACSPARIADRKGNNLSKEALRCARASRARQTRQLRVEKDGPRYVVGASSRGVCTCKEVAGSLAYIYIYVYRYLYIFRYIYTYVVVYIYI